LHEGGQVAAPVFKRIAEQVLAYLDVPRDVPLNPRLIQTAYRKHASENESALEDFSVVDFSGQPDPSPAASQTAGANGPQHADSKKPVLTVAVDQGGDIEVPDFSGKTMREVTDMALRLGLDPVLVGSNLATEQSPAAGAKVRRGAKITVQFGTPLEKKSKPHGGIRN
jgi:stage V sporulation protein D (sporulation-specific penicillin-binding protein)